MIVSFAEAAEEVLCRLAGLRVSEATAQRKTEAAGRELGRRLADGETFGPARDWAWHRDAEGKTCAYVSLDATAVPQQGPDATKADGRMATVAMVYNPIPEDRAHWADATRKRPPWQARSLASLEGQAGLGGSLRRQAAQVGMERAERWIALSDGGAGLEDWLRVNFGRVEAVIPYFENQVHRMAYPSYVAKGWQIGSGPVESACKTVVGQRLKCAGTRWGDQGSDGVCHLRALFLSERGQWDAFWARYRKAG